MADPHGWDAQNQAIRAAQQAAQQRIQEDGRAGGAAFLARQPTTNPLERRAIEPTFPPTSPPAAPFAAVLAYCPTHNLWGCAYGQSEMRRALYEAHSAASRHGSQWCKDMSWIKATDGFILSPGYVMVFRNRDGTLRWGSGRSERSIRRKLRRRLNPDAKVLLLLSVREGVLVNNGLDLQIGWTEDMPGGM